MIYKKTGKPDGILIFCFCRYHGKKYILVNGHKIVFYIALRKVGRAGPVLRHLLDKPLKVRYTPVDTFLFTTGIRIMYKNRLPDLLKIIHQDMMNYPIPEISGKYLPDFRFGGVKTGRTGWQIRVSFKRLF